ncbi:hypothetical protein [Natronorubrum texcoconense]|uniref:Uncharacterized protein n=1 Tax=Natronorubrum texcoconense TaxID=1095776 RepID=A0A1G9BXF0_9EURY|nr:hypothetical protein [Natronorubrum texcoconense]SDK44070.1 hypothetical protein SAMN04515672_3124 [Natronorubrum texcoconense]
MLESVPPLVETVIYGYFLLVAAIGCYLHGRFWVSARCRNSDELADEAPGLES